MKTFFILLSVLLFIIFNPLRKEVGKIAIEKEIVIEVVEENPIVVTATVYNAVVEQCNSDPSHTASMFKLDLKNPYKHRVIAVSRDLRSVFPYGTEVVISGTGYDGIYFVEDTMNKRYNNWIDILINEDMKIGKWKNVTIKKYDRKGS